MVGLYQNEEEALGALRAILRQKRKRGYQPAMGSSPAPDA